MLMRGDRDLDRGEVRAACNRAGTYFAFVGQDRKHQQQHVHGTEHERICGIIARVDLRSVTRRSPRSASASLVLSVAPAVALQQGAQVLRL